MIYLCPLQAGITHDQRVSFWAHWSGFVTFIFECPLPLYRIDNSLFICAHYKEALPITKASPGFITVVVQSLLPLYHIGNPYISLGPLQIGVTHDPTR